MELGELKAIVEALIFASDSPLKPSALASYVEALNGQRVEEVIGALNEDYAMSGRAFRIEMVAGGYQMTTLPEYSTWIKKMFAGRTSTRLSQPALETLAIISFKQPISKVEVSSIRGVNSDGVIKTLLERRLIEIVGRGEGVGKPLLYATTQEFLQYFGINDINDLPKPREIEELFGDSRYSGQIAEALGALEEEAQGAEEAAEAGEGKPDAAE